MALTEEQRAARQRYIGSSDAAAVLGRNPPGWPTAWDVWARVTGRLEPSADDDRATRLGEYLEPAILQWTEDYLGSQVSRSQMLIHEDGIACANLDGVTETPEGVALVEVKTSGLLGRPGFWEEWGEEGTDEVPLHVLLQVHHQFLVCAKPKERVGLDLFKGPRGLVAGEVPSSGLSSARLAYVPVLLGGRGFVMYRVERNDDLVAELAQRERHFWQTHVVADEPPRSIAPTMETLQRLKREPGKTVPVADQLVELWLTAQEKKKAAADFEDACHRVVLAALGDADAGESALGTVSFREAKNKGYTVAPFTYRRTTFKKAKPKEGADE